MTGSGKSLGSPPAAERLLASAEAERKLLKAERDAEKALNSAQSRLAKEELAFKKARARYERRVEDVTKATALLIKRQQVRAAGPECSSTSLGPPTTAVSEAPPESDASPRPAS